MKLKELKDTDMYICDTCKGVFRPSEIKLSDPVDNITMVPVMLTFVYMNKEGKITGGIEQPTKENGDKLLGCPLCDSVHLFGFNKLKE